MPAAERGAALMPGDRSRFVKPAIPWAAQRRPKSTSSRYDSKRSSSRPTRVKDFGAEKRRPSKAPNDGRRVRRRAGRPRGPSRRATKFRRGKSRRKFHRCDRCAWRENLARGEPRIGHRSQTFPSNPAQVPRRYSAQRSHPALLRGTREFHDSRRRRSRHYVPWDDARAALTCKFRRAVGRAVIHHDHFRGRPGLAREAREQALEPFAPVPNRHNGGDGSSKESLLGEEQTDSEAVPPRVQFGLAQPRRVLNGDFAEADLAVAHALRF